MYLQNQPTDPCLVSGALNAVLSLWPAGGKNLSEHADPSKTSGLQHNTDKESKYLFEPFFGSNTSDLY